MNNRLLKSKKVVPSFLCAALIGCFSGLMMPMESAIAAKQMEYLNRGVVAVRSGNGVYVSWRMLGDDPNGIGFNVYRDGQKISSSPITSSTNYFDRNGSTNSTYSVRPIVSGAEGRDAVAGSVWANAFHRIPLRRPSGGRTPDGVSYDYSANDASVGDLDGDGEYEYIVKWYPSNAKDNSQSGYTGNTYMDAYKFNGEFLWRIDLGRNIRSGAHYTQFIVYDLDGDGKSEIAMKTADGTVDSQGSVIGNRSADYRSSAGYVLSGPEYLSVFDGESGRELATTSYVPARGSVSSWGDNYGNRVDRFLAGVAYLDGKRPSLIMSRGYYTRSVVVAWDWRNGRLSQRWVFDSNKSGNSTYAGQGAHSLTVGDVDSDGKDEIVYGAATIDDNGQGLYSTKLGHGDALHLGDLNPERPGMEVYMVHETPSAYGSRGVEMHDARTGAILWSRDGNGEDVGRGISMDIDPRYKGNENWASRNGLVAADGRQISSSRPSQMNFGVYWDGDFLRELLDGETIDKWNYQSGNTTRLLTAYNSGAASNNGTKKNPALSADILGDWREEVIWRNSNNSELLIFTTTTETSHRLRTLMHDPQYRVGVAWQNVGYNQPPHTSFFLGDGMSMPPAPDIYFVGEDPNATGGGSGPVNPPATNEAEIPDGRYAIVSLLNGKSLTVAGGSSATGADVVQWASGENGQDWELKFNQEDGSYSIIAAHSGMSLAVAGASDESGANIIQQRYSGADNQSWYLQGAGNGSFVITSALSGKALDIYEFSELDGGTVVLWDNLLGDNQQWKFERSSNTGSSAGNGLIQEGQTGFCGVDGSVDSNNTGFTGSGFANTSNSMGAGIDWRVVASDDGEYTFTFRYASSVNRPARVIVDGNEFGTANFASSGGWSTWAETRVTVSLSKGAHSIRLEATGNQGLSNIDSVSLSSNVTGYDCDAEAPVISDTPDQEEQEDENDQGDQNASEEMTSTFVIEENASGFCNVDGNVGNFIRGSTGGYANTSNENGVGIEWAVNVPAEGEYTLQVRYAASAARSGQILVNDSEAKAFSFPGTGAWSEWDTANQSVYLMEGNNAIRLEATNSRGLAMVDNLSVIGVSPSAGRCF